MESILQRPSMVYASSTPSIAHPTPRNRPEMKRTRLEVRAGGPSTVPCVVNIRVREFEHIRRQVVQAGAPGVVSCILAVWFKGKGFAFGPSAMGSGALLGNLVESACVDVNRPFNDNTHWIPHAPSNTLLPQTTSGPEPLLIPSPASPPPFPRRPCPSTFEHSSVQ
ncbi:unnamed protein product [Rhizoctonia solani]|uniref:Uncharacterized protein n=1 Tax=Rhizoctonia solani TaxID=456999 RepID=A0A8H2WPX6_9AGAM|nr:unnamed protein product [Rhizoctonia solani]CAE6393545.1 unnamed protein product [Rhizoctonia solani]